MSYQVLARKWRPKTFAELSGQEHVVKALANALDRGRLHHAYLLTGTRGVGKTTIARLIAKSLNCVKGVTSAPCGVCDACLAIDAGRFVDLLELDAASNTGVDNMREILDNARYAPTVGRYKVYLIDEVHMLSKGAFNSMLKTLEEPPEHVKFVLATTDPQKVPITVLSRCLQFNLKPLPASRIEARLAHILDAEGVAHDAPALALLARAARGSLRDALSLLDQAIAFGAGEVRDEAVRAMLGSVDRDHLYRILDAVLADDGAALLAEADALAERGLAAAEALEGLASLLHRIAVAQVVPAAADAFDDAERVRAFASRMSPEATQLAWQIAIQGRDDLDLAPETATGFAMTLLRMLAFAPAADDAPAPRVEGASARGTTSAARAPAVAGTAVAGPSAARASASPPAVTLATDSSRPGPSTAPAVATPSSTSAAPQPSAAPASAPMTPMPGADAEPARPLPQTAEQWPAFVAALPLTGFAAQLAAQSEWRGVDGNTLTLALPVAHKHLADKAYADKLKAALEKACGRRLLLAFEVGAAADGSLASQREREREEARVRTEAAFKDEPFVRDVVSRFGATIKSDTIKRIP
ncbi:MAG TPA: DNA polymerase III subunit gamma/tau [Casimicrobiaceae bacterium]|nr:DNA polymerase III subunit gamma/tau [Casimicrobiaceae bacterium]